MATTFDVDGFLASIAGKSFPETVKAVRALKLAQHPEVASALIDRPEFRALAERFQAEVKNPDSFFARWLTIQAVLEQTENALNVFTHNAKLRELDPKAIEQAERAVLAIEDVRA